MSFRARLTLFFLSIVVLPMVAIAVLLLEITDSSRTGKADAQLATGSKTALAAFRTEERRARARAKQLLHDRRLQLAISSSDSPLVEELLQRAARRVHATYLRAHLPDGEVVHAGERKAIAIVRMAVDGDPSRGLLDISVTDPKRFARQVRKLTRLHVVVISRGDVIAETLPHHEGTSLLAASRFEVQVKGRMLRGTAMALPDPGGARLALLTALPERSFLGSSPGVAAALAVFLCLALAFIWFLVRGLRGQVATMLEAARRIGEGDFSQEVPVTGRDELAGLAREFNKMRIRLAEQMDVLSRQRRELDRAVRRLGEAFASGLDRDALLAIVLETALTACEAEYGRIALADGTVVELPDPGGSPAREAALAAEERVRRDAAPVHAPGEGAQALAAPLRPLTSDEIVGTMAIARAGEPFESNERDVFLYLTGQASASLENIVAHERVTEQASRDELTGLANSRAFRELLAREEQRAARFGHDLSLIMLDIDDFKHVNDTHGHLQGDEVLRMIGRVLKEVTRDIDTPARYGGEEFVVLLPETDTEGAVEVAERIRDRIAAERVRMPASSETIRVTASLGVATIPASARDAQELIAAADQALYAAKAAGKDRVASATTDGRARAGHAPREHA